ncbi:cupin domain-containing protein [Marispirochaeta aestuarii]|uniref:cupin domain-containing protein n=1 Tax=Marispirochaeta aestuarii TaxID=1963862 RepID=UPI0029C70C3A|nr:cupin domain-containing protein [Marispirochaeta aestuarii]
MSTGYQIQTEPFIVPTTDGKLIEEHFGRASSGEEALSIARMLAPAGWSEPPQRPDFDEYTLVLRGKKEVTVNGERMVLSAGESIKVNAGALVRYANPFSEETEYVSVCFPAFSPEAAHRQEE